ncbi:MAG: AbiU2 domain-containing protein [Gammaproteobacteria bacterium]
MSSPSVEFESQLELFRTEAQGALQFFYAWDATHAAASKDKAIFKLLNEAPLFWNTALGAMQAAALVALGRVFDPDQKNHSVTRLLALAHGNLDIFSKDALAARKRKLSPNADEWLPAYLKDAYVPTHEDFRRLKQHVSKRRKIYEEKYRPLRHKVFAHRGVTTSTQVGELFAKTNLRELQQLFVFFGRLYEALWQLYFNGNKPTLRPARYSVQRMLEQPSPNVKHGKLQERLVHETNSFLKRHSRDA